MAQRLLPSEDCCPEIRMTCTVCFVRKRRTILSKQCAFSEPISSVESTIYRGWQGEVMLRVGHVTGCTVLDTSVCVVSLDVTCNTTASRQSKQSIHFIKDHTCLHATSCQRPLNRVKDVCSICGTLIVIPKADATRTCGKTVREALCEYTAT